MSDQLTATNSRLAGVNPTLDEQGAITALDVSIALEYTAADGGKIGRTVTFDAWALMSDAQKTNMQDIQNTLMGYIISTYFA